MSRVAFLLSLLSLLLMGASGISEGWGDDGEDDIDMDELLDVLKRTRGRPPPATPIQQNKVRVHPVMDSTCKRRHHESDVCIENV